MLPLIPALLLLLLNGPAKYGAPAAEGYRTGPDHAIQLSRFATPESIAYSILLAGDGAGCIDLWRSSDNGASHACCRPANIRLDLGVTKIQSPPGQAEHSRDGPQ